MADKEEIVTGGCLCGAVRYELHERPEWAGHCHCRMCQRSTGAPVVTWIEVKTANLKFVNGTPKIYRSSSVGKRGFCPKCGAQLTCQFDAHPDKIDITVATLDDPDMVKPAMHVWTSSRLRFMESLQPDLTQTAEGPGNNR